MRIVDGKHEHTCTNCGCHDNDPDVDALVDELAAMTAAKDKAVEALKDEAAYHVKHGRARIGRADQVQKRIAELEEV